MLDKVLGLLGYPSVPDDQRGLNRLERAVCVAVAEMMYPHDDDRWPSYHEADVITEIHDFLQTVIPAKRRLIACLLLFTELFPMLRPPFRRFTRLSIDARKDLLNRWDSGRTYFFNLCAFSLRMLFNLAYLSHEKVKARIGEKPRDDCRENASPRPNAAKPDGTWQGIHEFPALEGTTRRRNVDFVVVGSGPGGAVVARELAEAGRSVVVLEQGPFYRPEEHDANTLRTLRDIYAEQGLRYTRGNTPIRTFQARALGGTSLVNSAICWRAPEWLFDRWRRDYGIEGLSREVLDPHYERAERQASVAPTDEALWGEKGRLFHVGCENIGVEGETNNRAMKNCRGCSECFHGCFTNAKQSMDRSYAPAAIAHGAEFFTSCRVEELIVENGRVAGVVGYVLEPGGGSRRGKVEVRARATVLAAGVTATPLILLKNKLPYKSPAIGRNLCFHNGIAVAGVFDREVEPWVGATQGYNSKAYLQEGIHMEVLWVPSAMMIARTRGFGDTLRKTMSELSHTAFWCIAVRGASRGRITPGRNWEPILRFNLIDADVKLLKRGADLLVDHFFAAGAVCVKPGVGGLASELQTAADVGAFKAAPVKAQQFVAGGNHVYGTTAMGADPRRAVVDSQCAAHGVPDLYICDTGVFPSQSAVNPQLTLMALSSRLAQTLDERY